MTEYLNKTDGVPGRPAGRETSERDAASYILIEEADFTALTEHNVDHPFINPQLKEAFDCGTNCIIAVPLYTAKGGPGFERENRGASLPQSVLQDPDTVTFQGQKVLLFTLVFHQGPNKEGADSTNPEYEFTQLSQSKFQALLHALQADAAKAASGGNVSRRGALASLLFGALAGAALMRAFTTTDVDRVLREKSPPPPTPPAPPAAPRVEIAPENIQSLPGLAAVLASSLMHFEPDRRSLRDPLLRPHVVSEAFLDNRFRYTGQGKKQASGQRVHTFTVIGNRSSYYDAQGNDRFGDTYLNHAINTLLDYENLSDDQIKEWIVFNYQTAFNVHLEAARITLTRSSKTKEISYVTYDPPPGFENRTRISFAKSVEDQSPLQPGGNVTTDTKLVPILASDNRLMLQSGISPDHDLYVPENLLDLDKTCERPLGKDGGYGALQMSATDLARAIHHYHNILDKKEQKFVITYSSDGQPLQIELCTPYIDGTDPVLRRLARQLLPKGVTQTEALRLFTEFVQSTAYVGENATDYHRPALITAFNGGSDCNSLVELWSSLCAACKIPHGIFYFIDRADHMKSHVTGAVPEKLAGQNPGAAQTAGLLSGFINIKPRPQLKVKGHVNQELTAPGYAPGDDGHSEMEIVVAEFLEFIRESTDPKISVSLRGKTN